MSNLENIELAETGFLTLTQVLRILPINAETWRIKVRKGEYPKGYKLPCCRITAWKEEDIKNLIEKISLKETQEEFQGNNFTKWEREKAKGKAELIKTMIKNGADLKRISELTKLTEKEIEELVSI